MDYAEFQELIDTYITRSSQQDDAIPAPTFLELLFDILSQRVQNVIRLEGPVINGELVLAPRGRDARAGTRESDTARRLTDHRDAEK